MLSQATKCRSFATHLLTKQLASASKFAGKASDWSGHQAAVTLFFPLVWNYNNLCRLAAGPAAWKSTVGPSARLDHGALVETFDLPKPY
jgi:hypothetical protein